MVLFRIRVLLPSDGVKTKEVKNSDSYMLSFHWITLDLAYQMVFMKRNLVEEVLIVEVQRGWKKGTDKLVEEVLIVEVQHGWKKGTKLTVYTRDGNDLVVIQKTSLMEALTGCTVNLPEDLDNLDDDDSDEDEAPRGPSKPPD
ncbi:hypothetical protein V8G54_007781 [Vigna mungo]|uniref:Uncharacterized protein n=1 Tax=Vigna mungo TaxID=3915 RepID=A0AAQ3P2B7_VIGMU